MTIQAEKPSDQADDSIRFSSPAMNFNIPPVDVNVKPQSFEKLFKIAIKGSCSLVGGGAGGVVFSCICGGITFGFFPIASVAVIATVVGGAGGAIGGSLAAWKVSGIID